MGVGTLAVVFVAVLASFFMAWALGASSNSPPFAPAVGANAIPTMRAAFLIGVFAAAGAVTQGGSISETVGTGLIDGVSFTPLAATAGLFTSALFIALGVRTGYPIPAAFAVTGAMVGAGLALGGDPAVDTYRRIVTFWLSVPFVSGSVAYATAWLLRHDDVPETMSIPLLGGFVGYVLANVDLTIIPGPTPTVAGFVSHRVGATPTLVGSYDVATVATSLLAGVAVFLILRRTMVQSVDAGVRQFLVGLGAVVAFSSGGSQVGLATGPLEPLLADFAVGGVALLVLGGVGILLGAWMGSPRLLQAVSREYSQLGVRRSIAALVPGFLVAQAAIALGIPISFNNIIISSVVGSGLVVGSGGVSRRKIAFTLGAWVTSLVSAILMGYGMYTLLTTVTGIE
ncbi:anion permease [Halomicrococcus sp. SG-WS-1]|uniref:inorganic phosphate transporter n=1 Tax=Halomicrococcus sp. SG-WS-1 TaxID=3439057 RepID=UPI003F793B8D